MNINVMLKVNGKNVSACVEPRTSLADFFRETLNLTGTHLGCEHGVCGACTILVDGVPARSCITFVAACDSAEIRTIEGLDGDEIAAELRDAFTREHALQCGYCTPGMLISSRDLVMRLDQPSQDEIRIAMSGNLCRCTGYVGIIRAIQSVSTARRARGIGAVSGRERELLGPVGSGYGAQLRSIQVSGELIPDNKPSGIIRSDGAVNGGPHALVDWEPHTIINQQFSVAHPPHDVWAFFNQVKDVALCLPGASLDGEPVDGHVEGQMRVKVGPIVAAFRGAAEITRDESTRTGKIIGSGYDQRSSSRTRGIVTYSVSDGVETNATFVNVSIGFTLTGMLAQFGRSGLVKGVASSLVKAFAKNLETRLGPDGAAAPKPPTEFDAGSSLFGLLFERFERFNRFINRIFKHNEWSQ